MAKKTRRLGKTRVFHTETACNILHMNGPFFLEDQSMKKIQRNCPWCNSHRLWFDQGRRCIRCNQCFACGPTVSDSCESVQDLESKARKLWDSRKGKLVSLIDDPEENEKDKQDEKENPYTRKHKGSDTYVKQVGGDHYDTDKDKEQHCDRQYRMFGPGYHIGQITKYAEKYTKKNGIEDLEKCKGFVEKLIKLEKANPSCEITEQQVADNYVDNYIEFMKVIGSLGSAFNTEMGLVWPSDPSIGTNKVNVDKAKEEDDVQGITYDEIGTVICNLEDARRPREYVEESIALLKKGNVNGAFDEPITTLTELRNFVGTGIRVRQELMKVISSLKNIQLASMIKSESGDD